MKPIENVSRFFIDPSRSPETNTCRVTGVALPILGALGAAVVLAVGVTLVVPVVLVAVTFVIGAALLALGFSDVLSISTEEESSLSSDDSSELESEPNVVERDIPIVDEEESSIESDRSSDFDVPDEPSFDEKYWENYRSEEVEESSNSDVVIPFDSGAMLNLKMAAPEQYYLNLFKRAAHVFSLAGTIQNYDQELNLEGDYAGRAVPMLAGSFRLHSQKNPESMDTETAEWLSDHLFNGIYPDNYKPQDAERAAEIIRQGAVEEPICIASGYDRHMTQVVFYGDYLIYINRGANLLEGSGINIYRIGDRTQITDHTIKWLAETGEYNEDNYCSEIHLVSMLDLTREKQIRMKPQTSGNCTYSSTRGTLRVLMAIRRMQQFRESWEDAYQNSIPQYKEWAKEDRVMTAEWLLQEVQEALLDPEDRPLQGLAAVMLLANQYITESRDRVGDKYFTQKLADRFAESLASIQVYI